jgi:DNA-binding LacI/PurR family transcriptional regulator
MTRSTHTVALMLHDAEMAFFNDPNISSIMLGAVQVLRPAGIQVVMIASGNDEDVHLASDYLRGGHVDGAMLVSGQSEDPLLQALAQSGLPHIIAGRPDGPFHPAFVDTDNYGASKEITSKLIATGRTRLLHVAGPQNIESARSRLGGFLSAVAENQVEGRVFAADEFGFDGGVRAAAEGGAEEIDGIVAASDALAAGVISELRRRRIRVPDQVGVVGFDDNPWALRTRPQLTTVRQDTEGIGRAMARYLLARFEGKGGEQDVTVLPYEVVWRGSAGPEPE